eukprot:TRINITY_DN2015_c0_g5_i1.p1 TRINITY_DN2015_c0_g5~~TRINITY_DN2015_c0_g5_i1.p1  ORF type:complete len:862 (+),score=108.13 TRINITY_DN2015_c0_g5_i1:63-2588(+)
MVVRGNDRRKLPFHSCSMILVLLIQSLRAARLEESDASPNFGIGLSPLYRRISKMCADSKKQQRSTEPLWVTLHHSPEGIIEEAPDMFQDSLQKTASYGIDLEKLQQYLRGEHPHPPGESAFDREWATLMKDWLPYLAEAKTLESPPNEEILKSANGVHSVRKPTKLLEIKNVKKHLESWQVLSSLQSELLQQLRWEATSNSHFRNKGFELGWTQKKAKQDMMWAAGSALLASVSIGSELGAFSGLYANMGIEHGFAFDVASKVADKAPDAVAAHAQMTQSIMSWAAELASNDAFQKSTHGLTPDALVDTLQWLQKHPPPESSQELVKHFYDTYSNFDMVVADVIGTGQNISASNGYLSALQASASACAALSLLASQVRLKKTGVDAPLETFPDVQQGHLYSVYAKIRDLLYALMISSNTNPIVRYTGRVTPTSNGRKVVPIFQHSEPQEKEQPAFHLPGGTLLIGTGRHVKAAHGRTKVRWRVSGDAKNAKARYVEAWIPSKHANRAPAYYVVSHALTIYSLVGDKCKKTSATIEVEVNFYVRSKRSLACPGCNPTDPNASCYCMELADTGGWVCPDEKKHGLALRRVSQAQAKDESVPYQLEDDDCGATIGAMQNTNKESNALFAARMGIFAAGLTAAIGGLLCPAGAATLGVMGMMSAGFAATDAVGSGMLNLQAQKGIDVRLEAFLFALAKWEYFMVKSESDCDITKKNPCLQSSEADNTKKRTLPWLCLREFAFFNIGGNKARKGWCVPALQPLQATGMPCTLSKECSSGYCHYDMTGKDVDVEAEKYRRFKKEYHLDETDLKAVVRSTGTCRKACRLNDKGCQHLHSDFDFGWKV